MSEAEAAHWPIVTPEQETNPVGAGEAEILQFPTAVEIEYMQVAPAITVLSNRIIARARRLEHSWEDDGEIEEPEAALELVTAGDQADGRPDVLALKFRNPADWNCFYEILEEFEYSSPKGRIPFYLFPADEGGCHLLMIEDCDPLINENLEQHRDDVHERDRQTRRLFLQFLEEKCRQKWRPET